MACRSEFYLNSNCKCNPWIIILVRGWLIRSYFYRSAGSRIGSEQGHHIVNRSVASNADRESQDKNFVGSLDRFAKTAGLRDSIFTHVYP